MFAESSLLTHTKKSVSSSELFLSAASKKNSSPHTSPLLKRAVSPSPDQPGKGSGGGSGGKVRKYSSVVLERSTMPRTKKDSVSFIM